VPDEDEGASGTSGVKAGGLSWLIGAAGLTGVLVAIGYTVRFAQGDLLGVSTYDAERAGYLLAAGDFVMHTLLLLANTPLTLLTLAVGLLLILGLPSLMRHFPRLFRDPSILATGLVLLCACHIVFFVLPAEPIKNTLRESVDWNYVFRPSLVHGRTEKIWHAMVCYRLSGQNPGSGCSDTTTDESLAVLDRNYTLAVLFVFLVGAAGWHLLRFSASESKGVTAPLDRNLWVWPQRIFLTFLLLTVAAQAYLYGKTIESTEFPFGPVEFAKGTDLATASTDRPGPCQTSSNEQPNPTEVGYFVISSAGDQTVMYAPATGTVLLVRNSVIDCQNTVALKDILEERMKPSEKGGSAVSSGTSEHLQ